VVLAIECGKISTSLLQRRLEVGYGRAAKIIDRMEELGYVSEAEGNKPRKILVTMEEYLARASGEMSEE
jgi:S-DNA-T family DNA segregation ATPase FtsK/SpoIIIE